MEKIGGKYFMQWETHSKQLSRGLCNLMERQCLVDVAISCGSNTMHAHKCILAANSSYFKEHFENRAVEQVVVNGLDFAVMKSIIEFMYCGESVIAEEHMKFFMSAVKLFKVTALESVFSESEYQTMTADEVCIPPPQFICKPPKYPTVFKPFNNSSLSPKINYAMSPYNQHKYKRKCLGTEAEKACAKEAQASRIALANLRKVMSATPQVHSFIVEESFNETTVENFIPSVDDNYNNESLNDSSFGEQNSAGSATSKHILPLTLTSNNQGLTADKIKHILGNDDVEIMFQTSDGNFVNVSDEVLLNLSKGGLQYQVVDEHGRVGEVQELKTLEGENDKNETNSQAIRKSQDVKIDALTKTNSEFVSNMPDYMKEGLRASGFGDGLYGNEIFEPENLSMHSSFLDDNPFYKFNKQSGPSGDVIDLNSPNVASTFDKGQVTANLNGDEVEVGEDNSKPPTSEEMLALTAEALKISSQDKSTLEFTPDMFFADLPSNTFEEDKVKN